MRCWLRETTSVIVAVQQPPRLSVMLIGAGAGGLQSGRRPAERPLAGVVGQLERCVRRFRPEGVGHGLREGLFPVSQVGLGPRIRPRESLRHAQPCVGPHQPVASRRRPGAARRLSRRSARRPRPRLPGPASRGGARRDHRTARGHATCDVTRTACRAVDHWVSGPGLVRARVACR